MFIMESGFGKTQMWNSAQPAAVTDLCSFTQENLYAYMASHNYLSGHGYLLRVLNDPFLANT